MKLLPTIHAPSDLKNIPDAQLPVLCQEIREEILEVTSRNGGHLAPNLGVVELTVALHKVFSIAPGQDCLGCGAPVLYP